MKTIPQRELRNHSGRILRAAESGERFVITVGGRPVAVLGPYPRRQWIPRAAVVRVLGSGRPDPTFFDDVADLGGTLDDFTPEVR